jgi:hypothetical protein
LWVLIWSDSRRALIPPSIGGNCDLAPVYVEFFVAALAANKLLSPPFEMNAALRASVSTALRLAGLLHVTQISADESLAQSHTWHLQW